jgi:hypothetical protein
MQKAYMLKPHDKIPSKCVGRCHPACLWTLPIQQGTYIGLIYQCLRVRGMEDQHTWLRVSCLGMLVDRFFFAHPHQSDGSLQAVVRVTTEIIISSAATRRRGVPARKRLRRRSRILALHLSCITMRRVRPRKNITKRVHPISFRVPKGCHIPPIFKVERLPYLGAMIWVYVC